MQEQSQNGNMLAPNSAAGAQGGGSGQQPKVQQTAFIHKLYKYGTITSYDGQLLTITSMLDDASISHLITWSPSEESFLMSPSNDFSKVLA